MDGSDAHEPEELVELKSIDNDTDVGEAKTIHRQAWSNKIEYILACVGNAVGLGNIWRFSYQCQKHGGGSFLVPYFIMLFLLGFPLLFLEISLGQKMRKGVIGTWIRVSPYVSGIGFATLAICGFLGLYYIVVVSWSLVYVVNSFRFPLPWISCPEVGNQTLPNITAQIEEVKECSLSSPTVYFWYRNTLNIADSIESKGEIVWWLSVSLLVTWTIVFVMLVKGTKSTGKAMYITVTFPYLVLAAFVIRVLLLDGSVNGILYLLKPDITKLGSVQAWNDAAGQIFLSLGMGFGVYITYASYAQSDNNCKTDTFIIASVNSLTSILSSFVVFGVLGFRATVNTKNCLLRNAELLNISIDDNKDSGANFTSDEFQSFLSTHNNNSNASTLTIQGLRHCSVEKELDEIVGGTGLAFIAFAEAMIYFPGSNFWSVLFFAMLVCLGVTSVTGSMMGIIAGFRDIGLKMPTYKLGLIICSVFCSLGLIFTTTSGSYILDMIDSNAASFCLLFVVLCETVSVGFLYGIDRFIKDTENMIKQHVGFYWKVSIKWICPLVLVGCLSAVIIEKIIKPPKYEAWDKETGSKIFLPYPWWGTMIIVFCYLLLLLPIPVFAVLHKMKIVNFRKIVDKE